MRGYDPTVEHIVQVLNTDGFTWNEHSRLTNDIQALELSGALQAGCGPDGAQRGTKGVRVIWNSPITQPVVTDRNQWEDIFIASLTGSSTIVKGLDPSEIVAHAESIADCAMKKIYERRSVQKIAK